MAWSAVLADGWLVGTLLGALGIGWAWGFLWKYVTQLLDMA